MRYVYKHGGVVGAPCAGAVTAAMELWEACFFLLTLELAFGKDIANVTYEIRKIDSCPVEGYFFRRELVQNQVSPGPCWLCFCQDNGTATCWQRDQKRCDVEKYHHHRVGRQLRYRRSLSDILFRDGTRDFFNKNLPEQCKPHQSFSNGCPPEDWCIGCTVCDCATNNRWDCHVLSFCDGKEKKRKVKPGSSKTTRIKPGNNSEKKVKPTKKPTRKPYIKPTTKTPAKNVRKVVRAKNNKKVNNQANRNTNRNNKKWNHHKVQETKQSKKIKSSYKVQETKQSKKIKSSYKVQSKPIQIRRSKQNKTQIQPNKIGQNHKNQKLNNASKVKVIRRAVATRKPIELLHNAVKGLKLNPNSNDTVKIGQKIIKQVMTVFQKIMRREMDKVEMERKQKIVDGLDCGKVNKRDKRTYNERSKAAGRNKNKYNRPTLIKENYTHARSKREIMSNDKSKIDNVSVITLPIDGKGVIPLEIVTKQSNLTKKSTHNLTKSSSDTTKQKHYYTYQAKNNTNLSHTTEKIEKSIERNESDIQNNFLISNQYSNNISNIRNEILHDSNVTVNETLYGKQNDMDNNTDINPDFNDLKFDKWQVVKLKKEVIKNPDTKLVLPSFSTKSFRDVDKNINITSPTTAVPKIHFFSERKVSKYAVTRQPKSETSYNHTRTHTSSTTRRTDVTGLKNIVESLFTEINSTNNKPHKKHRKFKSKVSILRYVRRFFHNLFSKKKSNSHKVYGLGSQEDHTLQILCENVGHCRIKKNSKLLLKYRLNQLNKETKLVLKSIRTVKGLLHLLELPGSNNPTNDSFQTDIQKLGTVLRDYKDNDSNPKLTFTQKTQIDYIKKNTQTFIESVKKFADTLTEILEIITPISQTDYPVDFLRYAQTTPVSKEKNNKAEHKLDTLKDILYNYNIMQNTFMKKIYALIKGEEKLTTTTARSRALESFKTNTNGTDNVIEKYSRNIIDSLRRLKSIVHILTAKRRKRDLALKDDALDYLLMMMEFLIHNNNKPNQRSTGPDHDGIDLLIDAIRSAPDIQPIKKFVVIDYDKSDYHTKATTSKHDISDSSDSFSDSKRISNEESPTDFYGNSFMQDNDLREAPASKIKLEEPAITAIEEESTQKVYYRKFNEKAEMYESETTSKNEEKVGFDKFESFVGEAKKFEVYNEDDQPGYSTTDNTISMLNSDTNNITYQYHAEEKTPKLENSHVPIRKQSESSSQSREYLNNNKTKFDWIEETFDREIKEFSRSKSVSSSHTPRTTKNPVTRTQSTTIRSTHNSLTRLNKVARENLDGNIKSIAKKTGHLGGDDVMTMKQLRFLNSLDYGTDKSVDFEEAETKDETRSDGDDATYFV